MKELQLSHKIGAKDLTYERRIASAFGLSNEAWLRHANPWSVWTRCTVLPLLVLAFWSRTWLSLWSAVPIIIALAWMLLNPRVFSKPRSTTNWASKGVLGERVWINRDRIRVPDHHRTAPNVLNAIGGTGILFVIWGTYSYEVWPILFGLALVYSGKLWFFDRMVWLLEDMKHVPEYKDWLY